MHPKAYEVAVRFEQDRRADIATQIAKLNRLMDESWEHQQGLELPNLHPMVSDE